MAYRQLVDLVQDAGFGDFLAAAEADGVRKRLLASHR